MSKRKIEAERIATGCHDVWSLGPYDRPSRALREGARFVKQMEPIDDDHPELIAAFDDVRLIRIGHTWWVEVQMDNASMMSIATPQEMGLVP